MRSPARVLEELESVPNEQLLIVDDNFFAGPKRAETIGKLIKERGIMIKYMIQARTDSIVNHRELLELWSEIGLRSVFLGFEKVDQASLDAAAKQNNVETNEKSLELLREYGIEPVVAFIVDPQWTRDDMNALKNYVRKLRLGLPFFTVLTPLPGTEAFEESGGAVLDANRDLFDLLHPLVPTNLPLGEFAEEMANLYTTGYPFRVAVLGGLFLLTEVARGHLSFGDWREMVRDRSMLTIKMHYLCGAEAGTHRVDLPQSPYTV